MENGKFDLSRLNGRIVEKFGTREKFAWACGLSPGKLYPRLRGIVPFRADEISIITEVLDIPPEEIPEYFFKPQFEKSN